MSLSFLLTALGTAHSALLNREMRFKSLELRMMAGTFVGGIVGIAVAYAGYGAWAIIWQQLAIAAVSTAFLASRRGPAFVLSGAAYARWAGQAESSAPAAFYMNRKLDHMLIGRFLGASALGAYAVAYNVMLMPLSRIAQPVVEVLFPAMSRIQDDRERMASMWLRANRLIGAISIPAMVGLMIVAPEFGRRSSARAGRCSARDPDPRLGRDSSSRLQRLNSSVLQATDRTGTLLATRSSSSRRASSLSWAPPLGDRRMATAYAISSTLIEPYYAWITARVLDVRLMTTQGRLPVSRRPTGNGAVVLAAKLWLVLARPGAGSGSRSSSAWASAATPARGVAGSGAASRCARPAPEAPSARHRSRPDKPSNICYQPLQPAWLGPRGPSTSVTKPGS